MDGGFLLVFSHKQLTIIVHVLYYLHRLSSMSMGKSGKAKSSKSSCLEDEEIEEGAGDEGTDEEEMEDEGTIVDGGIDLDGDGQPDVDLDRASKSICQCHPPLRCSSRHHI